jgi:hypothetical protein
MAMLALALSGAASAGSCEFNSTCRFSAAKSKFKFDLKDPIEG